MKTVGIIGGLGPETTALFYQEIISLWVKNGNMNRPKIIIWNVPISFRLERSVMNGDQKLDDFFALLAQGVDILQSAGCDFIVIPCNTAHLWIEELRSHAIVPMLDIVAETTSYLKENKINSAGVLATPNTIKSRLYDKKMGSDSIMAVYPGKNDIEMLGKIIEKLTRNQYSIEEKQEFEVICERLMSKKVDSLLLACTDLQIIAPKTCKIPIFDTMKILAAATVRELQQVKC